jgi:uncharacterized membrane protein
MDSFLTLVAAYIQLHAVWLVSIISVLYVISEALPHFPNIEANNTVKLLVNIITLLKQKLSLKPADTTPTTPAA